MVSGGDSDDISLGLVYGIKLRWVQVDLPRGFRRETRGSARETSVFLWVGAK